MNIYEQIIEKADALRPELQRIRRDLHAYPETGWQEVRTSSIIAQRLTELGYTVLMGNDVCKADARMGLPDAESLEAHYQDALVHGAVQPYAEAARDGFTGVIGILDCGEGPTIAMRFDIDALGVVETQTEEHIPYKEGFCSAQHGAMHACGHDGHTAMGLGTAQILASFRNSLRGRIKLIFQPAEEGVRGARSIAENGHLDDVDYLLGNHIWERESTAAEDADADIGATTGSTLATSKLDIFFYGKACHAGAPDLGNNAMLAAATAILNMQAIPRCGDGATRVNVGTIQGGTGRNVICDRVKLEVEVRGATTELNEYMEMYCRRIAEQAAAMHDCSCEIRLVGAADSFANDPQMIEQCFNLCRNKLGLKVQPPTSRISVSEDYSYLANAVTSHGGRSLFFYTLSDLAAPKHATAYDFEEKILATGVKVFSAMAFALGEIGDVSEIPLL